jgi:hypothetical protein
LLFVGNGPFLSAPIHSIFSTVVKSNNLLENSQIKKQTLLLKAAFVQAVEKVFSQQPFLGLYVLLSVNTAKKKRRRRDAV